MKTSPKQLFFTICLQFGFGGWVMVVDDSDNHGGGCSGEFQSNASGGGIQWFSILVADDFGFGWLVVVHGGRCWRLLILLIIFF